MKSKQLANVIIKILGIFFMIQNLPVVVVKFLNINSMIWSHSPDWQSIKNLFIITMFGAIEILIVLWLILRSKTVAEFLFKNEEE